MHPEILVGTVVDPGAPVVETVVAPGAPETGTAVAAGDPGSGTGVSRFLHLNSDFRTYNFRSWQ